MPVWGCQCGCLASEGLDMAVAWQITEPRVHVPWDKQTITWHTGGFFCGVKLSHLHLPRAEPTNRDDS